MPSFIHTYCRLEALEVSRSNTIKSLQDSKSNSLRKFESLEESIDQLKHKNRGMQNHIATLTEQVKDATSWITIGDQGASDRFFLRSLLDEAQGLLAQKLSLGQTEATRSLDLRMAIGPSSDMGDRCQRLRSMIERSDVEELASLITHVPTLNLLADCGYPIRSA